MDGQVEGQLLLLDEGASHVRDRGGHLRAVPSVHSQGPASVATREEAKSLAQAAELADDFVLAQKEEGGLPPRRSLWNGLTDGAQPEQGNAVNLPRNSERPGVNASRRDDPGRILMETRDATSVVGTGIFFTIVLTALAPLRWPQARHCLEVLATKWPGMPTARSTSAEDT